MFQVGFGEVLVVLMVALWVLGPEKLPAVARVAGRWVARAKNIYLTIRTDFTEELRAHSTVEPTPTSGSENSADQPPPAV